MKILLDENVPHDLRHFLPGFEVFTVTYWGGRASRMESSSRKRVITDSTR